MYVIVKPEQGFQNYLLCVEVVLEPPPVHVYQCRCYLPPLV